MSNLIELIKDNYYTMATINGSDKMMGMASSSPMRSSASPAYSQNKDVLALLWVLIALNVILIVSSGYIIWRVGLLSAAPAESLPAPAVTNQQPITQQPTAQQPISFWGRVVSIDENRLTIQEIVESGKKGVNGKIRTALLNDKTVFAYQKPNTGKDAATLPYIATPGTAADLKEGTNALFAVNEELESPKLTISRVDIADKFPFDYEVK